MDSQRKHPQRGRQSENSRQSGKQGGRKHEGGRTGGPGSGTGIGSSQGQDRASPQERQERPGGSGTADVERGAQPAPTESLVNDMTGAYKERP